MAMTIFSNLDGGEWKSREASPDEEIAEEKRLLEKKLDAMEELDKAMAATVNLKKWKKRCKDRGLVQTKTKSQFAWRSREQKASSPTVVRRSDLTKPDTWSYVSPGEPAPFDFDIEPRLKYTNPQRFEILLITKGDGNRIREQLIADGFRSACDGEKSCYKTTCARCWHDAYIDLELKDNQFVLIREKVDLSTVKVVDPAGVDPRGSVNSSRKDLGEDQKGMFALTSKIIVGDKNIGGEYKSGNNSSTDGEVDRLGRLL